MSRIRNTPRTQRDAGFTLIELVMAVTLSVMLIGAMVGALLTSISAASSNRDRVRDSVDLGLISAFLYKDAQAVGGSDPTVVNDATLGVSATDAAGCTSTGLVARFKWDDPTGSATTTFVVTYGLTGTNLSRFECKEGKLIDTQVLGRNVKSATLTCSPTCGRLPQTVSVRIIGSNTKSPLDQVLTASVRPSSTTATSSIGQTVDLMTLDSRCPALDLSSGTNSVTVGGQGVVSISGCKTPVDDPHQQLANYPVITSGVSDPLAGTVAIATPSEASNGDGHGGEGEGQYDNGGGNCYGIDHPTTIHRSGFPDITYYPSTVTISTHTHFAPGDYVYCRGLTVTSAGSIEGSGLFIQVSNGYGESDGHYAPLDIDHAASINATPQTTGTYAGILFWVASSRDVAIGLDGPVANYGGLIYAPKANVTFSSDPSSVSANIDAVIARQVTFSDAGTVHFGGAPSDISISPSTPPSAVAGQPYSTTFTAPGLVDARWSAPDLPTGMTIDNSGTVSGSAPSCDGSVSLGSIVAFDNADANAAAAGATFDGLYTTRFTSSSSVTYQPLTVRPFAAVTDPGTWVHGTVPLSASATNCLRSTTVAFQSRTSPSGSWSNISGCSATTAGQATLANFTCNWTPTSGTNYDLQVIATDHALSNTSAIVS
ncbi:MAG: prepilin-type N-terminal cleavage/methylation domain-containing protein, partial [Actinomycetota bacterium]